MDSRSPPSALAATSSAVSANLIACSSPWAAAGRRPAAGPAGCCPGPAPPARDRRHLRGRVPGCDGRARGPGHRPSLRETSTGRPKHCVSTPPVSTSGAGPHAAVLPSRSSSAWPVAGGSSSRWWVTVTVAGDGRSAASRRSASIRPSREGRSSASTGSDGAGIGARAMSTRARRPPEHPRRVGRPLPCTPAPRAGRSPAAGSRRRTWATAAVPCPKRTVSTPSSAAMVHSRRNAAVGRARSRSNTPRAENPRAENPRTATLSDGIAAGAVSGCGRPPGNAPLAAASTAPPQGVPVRRR